MQLSLSQGLRDILLSILEDSPSEDQVTRLVRICHALADPFVASKCAGGANAHLVVGLSSSDIAYDCLGDLFARDERGGLPHVKSYFLAVEVSRATDVEILMHLRRLVFSAVNQGIYRLYRQSDPAFGKILRNIKLAVATLQNFMEIERFGEVLLVPVMADPLLECPPFEAEALERAIAPLVSGSHTIPELLGALSLVLRQQKERSRAVPLTMIASLFRSVFAWGRMTGDDAQDPQGALMQEQVREAISRAAREAVKRTLPGYCKEHGWKEHFADAYRQVVEKNLAGRLLQSDGSECSYFAGLRAFIPDLTREGYLHMHKNKVEYVGRMAYEMLVAELKKEIR